MAMTRFICDTVGSWGRAAGGATRRWGGAAWPVAARTRRSHAEHDLCRNRGRRGLVGGPPLQSRAAVV
jgi:hypothetical protein